MADHASSLMLENALRHAVGFATVGPASFGAYHLGSWTDSGEGYGEHHDEGLCSLACAGRAASYLSFAAHLCWHFGPPFSRAAAPVSWTATVCGHALKAAAVKQVSGSV